MDASAAIPQLTRWGISPDADLVYRALAVLGRRTPGRLAAELGLGGKRVRDALDQLAQVGAAHPSSWPGSRDAWRAEPVPTVLRSVRSRPRRRDDDQLWRRHLAAVTASGAAVPSDRFRRWPTRAATRERVAQLIDAERYEHLTINTEQVFDSEATAAALPLDRAMLARGIRLRVLGLPPADGDRGCGYAANFGDLGGLYRERPTLPIKLLIFDRRTALFPVDPVRFERGYVEVDDPPVVAALVQLFQRTWQAAEDPRRKGVKPIELSLREQAIVDLLATGMTDQAVADQLHLSVRTVSYSLRGLMDRLGAENRFQLALLLGAAGATTAHHTNPEDS